jgi:hypothetical protein
LAEPIGEIAQENEDRQNPERPMDIEFGPEWISQIKRLKHGEDLYRRKGGRFEGGGLGLKGEALDAIVS